MNVTSDGRADGERDAAEAEQETDGLSGTLLAAEVKRNRAEQADEAAVK